MAGRVSFDVSLYMQNADKFPELAARSKDLTIVFEHIIRDWAEDNRRKFGLSSGMESSGATVDPTVFWQGLSPAYIKQKNKGGFADQIMVRTGSLRDSLTDPEQFFQYVSPDQAMFGSPNDPDDAMKMLFNWPRRQTIFLGRQDQLMIEKHVKDYLSFGPVYEQILFAKGMQAVADRKETAHMEVEFSETVANPET